MLRSYCQKFRDADTKSLCKDFECAERNVALFALHRANIRAVKLAEIG